MAITPHTTRAGARIGERSEPETKFKIRNTLESVLLICLKKEEKYDLLSGKLGSGKVDLVDASCRAGQQVTRNLAQVHS